MQAILLVTSNPRERDRERERREEKRKWTLLEILSSRCKASILEVEEINLILLIIYVRALFCVNLSVCLNFFDK
jgi:hypothetical protein